MNAAIEEWADLARSIRGFCEHRIETQRLAAVDAGVLRGVLLDTSITLSPFAPHLAEECRAMLDEASFAATARWPVSAA